MCCRVFDEHPIHVAVASDWFIADVNKKLDKVAIKAKKIFETIENTAWGYAKNLSKASATALSIAKSYAPNHAEVLGKISSSIGALSVVGLYYSLKAVPGHFTEAWKNIKLRDFEGSLLQITDTAMHFLDMATDIGVINSALNAIASVPKNSLLQAVSFPFAIALLTYHGAVRGAHSLFHHIKQRREMPKNIQEGEMSRVTEYLNKKLDVEASPPLSEKKIQVLKDKNINRLTRRTDKKVVAIMQNLKTHLADYPNDLDTANKALADMRTLMKRKIVLVSISSVINTLFAALLCLSKAALINSNSASFYGIFRNGVQIGTHFFKHRYFERNLNLPNFIKTAA